MMYIDLIHVGFRRIFVLKFHIIDESAFHIGIFIDLSLNVKADTTIPISCFV